jgi:ADP-heptose:LPS heptosyltransferase
MNQHKIKALRKVMRKQKQEIMIEFFDSLKEVGIILRIKVCYQLVFTNFRIFNKKVSK